MELINQYEKIMHSSHAMQAHVANLEKQASLLGLLGMGAAMHIAPNAAMKVVKSTRFGHNALTGSFDAGVDMGKQGLKLQHNWHNLLEYGVGPESLVEMKLGQHLGTHLHGMDPERQERFLGKLRDMAQQHLGRLPEETRNAAHKVPVVGTFLNYLNGGGNQTVKDFLMKRTVPADQKPSLLNRLGDVAMLGGAAAADPHLLLQPAISGARKFIGQSELGKRIALTGFHKGRAGETLSKFQRGATDLLVSPSALDPYRIGRAIGTHLPPGSLDSPIQKLKNSGVFD